MSVCWCHNLLEIGRPKNSQTFFSEDKKATFSEVAISKLLLRGRTAAWLQIKLCPTSIMAGWQRSRKDFFVENILN